VWLVQMRCALLQPIVVRVVWCRSLLSFTVIVRVCCQPQAELTQNEEKQKQFAERLQHERSKLTGG
jgi:hypothetical protein